MPYEAIRDQVLALVDGVAAVGLTHDRAREDELRSEANFDILFVTGGIINAWIVERAAVAESHVTEGEQTNVEHRLEVTGWRSLDDAGDSRTTFGNTVESVRTALRWQGTLGATAYRVRVGEAIEGEDRLGNWACHKAVIPVVVEERLLGANSATAVPAAPAATAYDQVMDALAGVLAAAPIQATVSRGRNFPLTRTARAALLSELPRTELARASDQRLDRIPVAVFLSYDVADTPGTGPAATGADAKRHVRQWIDTIYGEDGKTITDATWAAVAGLVDVEVETRAIDLLEMRPEDDGPPFRVRIEAALVVAASVWRSTA